LNKISDLKDIYKDKLCFLIGAGPSLHFINTNILKDYVTITINSGVLKVPDCDLFVSDDEDIKNFNYYINLLPTLNCIKLLYRNKLEKYCKNLNRVILFSHKCWFSPSKNTYNPEGIILTKDEPIIGAINSVGSALHIAYIMGASVTVLLGCDCCYSKEGYRYYFQYPGEKKAERINKNYRKINDSYFEHEYTEKSVKYWNALAKANKNILDNEMMIIDASNSILSCFPKMSINDILEKYGNRKKE
jgi:hypothetical protein